MAQDYTLFGPNVQEAQQALDASYLQQAMLTAQHSPALANNPFYLPSTSALINKGMDQFGSLFGYQPAEIKKAYEMEGIQKEVDSMGIDFDKDPIGYAKIAASKMLAKGYRKEALSAMQWALDSGVKLSEIQKNLGAGGSSDSDKEQAQKRVIQWIMKKRGGIETSMDEDLQTQADLELVEPLQKTDSGDLIYAPGSIREIVEGLMGQKGPSVVQTQALAPVVEQEQGVTSAYSTTPYTGDAGERRIPNPQRRIKDLNEATDRVLNDIRQRPILPLVENLDNLERKLEKYLKTGEDIPGVGFGESWFTIGAGSGWARSIYGAAAEAGNKTAQEALGIMNAVDALMAIDISKWAGASQTIMEAERQFRAKALTKGATQASFIEAFKNYKNALAAELAAYFGGLDPAVKDRLKSDAEFGTNFKKAFEIQPFGIPSGLPKGVPSGAQAIGRDARTGKVIYEKDGKRYVED